MSKLVDNLHPLHGYKIRGLRAPSGKENDAFIDALQKGLDDAEDGMYQAKLDSFLDTARGRWLDYWGSWLGLHRLSRDDDTYREALKAHVLHKRDTIDAIREAIAKYLKTNISNIFIYEPFRDMFIWNGSHWNTYKFWPSTYYRYAVIDVQIDNPFNNVISEIINLFRPAGVYWVITSLLNVLNRNAPIVDFSAFAGNRFITEDIDYIGFIKRNSHYINTNFSTKTEVDNPFIYNDSLLNGGKVYYRLNRAINGVAWFGQGDRDLYPRKDDTYLNAIEDVKTLSTFQNNQLSRVDNNGVAFNLAEPDTSNQRENVLTFASNWSLGSPSFNRIESGTKTTFYLDDNGHQVLRYDMPKGVGTVTTIGYYWYFRMDRSSKYLLTWDMRGENANGTNIINERANTNRIGNTPISKNWNRFGATFITNDTDGTHNNLVFYSGLNDNTKDGWIEFRNPCLEKLPDDIDLSKVTKIPEWIDNRINLAKTTPYGIIDFYDYLASYFDPDKVKDIKGQMDLVLNQIDSCSVKNIVTRFIYDGASDSNNILYVYAYNFDLNLWERLTTFNITSKYQSFRISFNTIKPYLNDHMMMFVKYMPNDYTGVINTDYFGFSYGNNIFGDLDCIMPSQLGLGSDVYTTSSMNAYPITEKAVTDKDVLHSLLGITTILSQNNVPIQAETNLGSITYSLFNKYVLSLDYRFTKDVQPLMLSIINQRTGASTEIDLTNGSGDQVGTVNVDLASVAEKLGIDIQDQDVLSFTIFGGSVGNIHNLSINRISSTYKTYGKNLLTNDHALLVAKDNTLSNIKVSIDNEEATINFGEAGTKDFITTMDKNNNALPDTVTVSFSAKGTGKISSVSLYNKDNDTNSQSNIKVDLDDTFYQRISYTTNSGASNYDSIDFRINGVQGQTVSIKNIKIEQGVVSTPYN